MMKKKRLISFLALLFVTILTGVLLVIRLLFGPNIKTYGETVTIFIPDSASYNQALDTIGAHFKVEHPAILNWVARKKNYPSMVKPGRYIIESDISYTGLIDLLRSGRQSPMIVTFNKIRTVAELAGRVGGQIEADSLEIMDFLSDPENYSKDGFVKETIISVFIPNTYEIFWNTSAKGFYKRMLKEYRDFWTDERKAKAEAIGFTPVQISTLASIVDEEAAKTDEKPRIAGVYLNRLAKGIPLQADPTIIFALGDFSITRVLTAHLKIDSPYNTYKYRGLPPGPINSPSISGIDAVLNAEKHDYLYFSAKADFSGYHNFSRSLSEHNRYAAEYHRELNRRRIFR